MRKQGIILELIKKQQHQELSPEEEFILDVWYETYFQESQRSQKPQGSISVDDFNQQILDSVYVRTLKKNRSHSTLWFSIAASIFILLSLSLVLTRNKHLHSDKETISGLSFTEYRTEVGKLRLLQLGDGTRILLKPNSNIKIYKDFGHSHRLVSLSGDAFFDVAKDSLLAFKIKSPAVDISVLGTSFNVNAREGQDKQVIDVVSGRVLVSRSGKFSQQLVADNRLEYSKANGSISFTPQSHISSQDWHNGVVHVKDRSLTEIMDEFYQAFGVKIICDDATISKSLYSISIRMRRGPLATIEQLAIVTKKQFRKENGQYILY